MRPQARPHAASSLKKEKVKASLQAGSRMREKAMAVRKEKAKEVNGVAHPKKAKAKAKAPLPERQAEPVNLLIPTLNR